MLEAILRLPKWFARFLLLALAVSYFGSLLFAATEYPTAYEWRHTVMSSLASPVENPQAYRVASYGMALSGILLSILTIPARNALQPHASNWTAWARSLVVLGGILLTVSALLTPGYHTYFGLPKAHAKIAQAAGFCFSLGMALNLPAIIRLPDQQTLVRRSALFLVTVPVSLYLLCRIILPAMEPFAPLGVQDWIQESILGSLAFWEWVGSISVYLFLALVILNHRNFHPRLSDEARKSFPTIN